jgi:hypothetical protein
VVTLWFSMVCPLVDMVLVSEWKIIVTSFVAFLIWIYADLEHGGRICEHKKLDNRVHHQEVRVTVNDG